MNIAFNEISDTTWKSDVAWGGSPIFICKKHDGKYLVLHGYLDVGQFDSLQEAKRAATFRVMEQGLESAENEGM